MSNHYFQINKISEELSEKQSFIDYMLDAHSSISDFEKRIAQKHGISNMTFKKWLNGVDIPHKIFRDKILDWLNEIKK